MADLTKENERLKDEISNLESLVELQRECITNYETKTNELEIENIKLKKQIKSINNNDIEINRLKNIISQQNIIINKYKLTKKWQFCLSTKGYKFIDYNENISKKIENSYVNGDEIFELKFKSKQNKYNNLFRINFNEMKQYIFGNYNEVSNELKMDMNCIENVTYIQRVNSNDKNSYLDPNKFIGPPRKMNGNKILKLYHATDKKSAMNIKKLNYMIPGVLFMCIWCYLSYLFVYIPGIGGLFGGGIYFAETNNVAKKRARKAGYIITAMVFVGKELTFKKAFPNKINKSLYDSIYAPYGFGEDWKTGPERVVYNSDQICIVSIHPY